MAIFRPFVEAIQWLGTNVTEIRQFIRANQGYFNNAVIRDGVLYLQTFTPDPVVGTAEIPVPVNNWVIRSGDQISTVTDSVFISQYTPE
jgi:hypothetical protein